GTGTGATPGSTFGYEPEPSTWVIVPSDALVSIAIANEPLPIPSRSSNALGPVSGLVWASPSFTMPDIHWKIWTPAELSNTVLVARAFRPLLLFTKSEPALARKCSKNPGSSFRPRPACDTV